MPIETGAQILAADVNEILNHSFQALGYKMASLNPANMTVGVEGTGVNTQTEAGVRHTTGATANGRGYGYFNIYGLGEAAPDGCDWDKPLHLSFSIARRTTSANCRGRVQLDHSTNEADLAAVGIGIVIKGFVLYGESYGAGRAETSLSTTMVDEQQYVVDIVHTPGTDVKFYVDGVLQATHSTAANVPSGEVGSVYLISSIDNQADNIDAELWIGYSIPLWQEKT